MKNLINSLLLFLIVVCGITFLLNSCIDPINLTLEDKDEFLVVDGRFTTSKGPHNLKLYYATGQRTIARRPVANAKISLLEDGVEIGDFQELNSGNYQFNNTQFVGEVDKSYAIEITLENGAKYQSSPEVMPRLIQGENVFFDYNYREETVGFSIIPRPYIETFISTKLPQNDSPYWLKWEMKTMYSFPEVICGPIGPPPEFCYVTGETEVVQEVNLLNGANLQTGDLPKWKVGEKLLKDSDFEFRGKHYFLVNQQSITEDAYNYWNNINLIANQTGGIFDAPPAAIPGNIFNVNDPSEVVLGYFELSSVDSLRGFVTEGDFFDFHKFTDNVCPKEDNPFARFERVCCRCESIANSTFNRPDWW